LSSPVKYARLKMTVRIKKEVKKEVSFVTGLDADPMDLFGGENG